MSTLTKEQKEVIAEAFTAGLAEWARAKTKNAGIANTADAFLVHVDLDTLSAGMHIALCAAKEANVLNATPFELMHALGFSLADTQEVLDSSIPPTERLQ